MHIEQSANEHWQEVKDQLGGCEEIPIAQLPGDPIDGWELRQDLLVKRLFFEIAPQTLDIILHTFKMAMEENKALRVIADYNPQDLNVRLRYFTRDADSEM